MAASRLPAWARLERPRAGDLGAGISVAILLIPQSIAYAQIAGLPPQVGLFAGALPLLVAAPLVSSPYLQTGPVALTSLLTLGALSGLATEGSPEYVQLAALLAVLVAGVRVVMAVARLGIVAYLMSEPVLVGFTAAAGLLIAASQVPAALGTTAPDGGVLRQAGWSILHAGDGNAGSAALAALTVVLVLGGRRVHRLVPGVLVAALVGLAVSSWTDFSGAVVGEVPAGLPHLSLALPWSQAGSLALAAVIIALVGFAEDSSISRIFATADRQAWSANREALSQGAANLAAGLSGGYPVAGSFSRSALNRHAGAETRWSGALTGALVLAFLPVASVLDALPRSVLAAVVIVAVAPLVRVDRLWRMVRKYPVQATVGWVTFGATLLTAPYVERGLLVGAGLAIVVHLRREMRLRTEIEVAGTVIRARPRGSLWFGSVPAAEEALLGALAAHPEAEEVVLDLSGLGMIDYTASLSLQRLVDEARAAGATVRVEHVPPDARVAVETALGPDLVAGPDPDAHPELPGGWRRR
ncbi:MAG: SulP family inorganic anion transporter [Acidimicrobiales bacterium]|nr:SulP family inorganic anion transporter [Acidimicrobiales bacterium]